MESNDLNMQNRYSGSYESHSGSKYHPPKERGGLIPVTANIIKNAEVTQDETVEFQGVNIIDITAVGYVVDFQEVENKISITLYDSNGKEISIKDIKEAFRPQILYLKEKYNHLKACYYYDENRNDLVTDGISAVKKVEYMGKEYFKCVSSHLSSFTAGTYGSNDKSNTATIVLIIVGIIVLIAIALLAYIIIRRRASQSVDVAKDFNTKEGLVSA